MAQTLSSPSGCRSTPTSHAVPASRAPWHPPTSRSFSHTSQCQKKRKHSKSAAPPASSSNPSADGPDRSTTTKPPSAADPNDPDSASPFDFTDLQNAFARAETRYLDDLKKLRSGGRFNADVLGAIPVQPDKKSTQTFPLRELATVAPLGGRRWSILAFEESSVKPIVSAVQRSPEFNQQPQRSEENPLELTMTVEPERADALAKRAKEVCQAWRTKVRDEAHKRGEMHKKWKAEGAVLSDDVHKLKGMLQKLQDERMKGIMAKEKEVVAAIMAKGG